MRCSGYLFGFVGLLILGGCASREPADVSAESSAPLTAASMLTSYGQSGIAPEVAGTYMTSATLSDGSLVVAGLKQSAGARYEPATAVLARYTRDGALDTAFGNQGIVEIDTPSEANCGTWPELAIAAAPNGAIYTAMQADCFPFRGPVQLVLARLTSTGALDPTFGSAGIRMHMRSTADERWSRPRSALVQPDGRLVLTTNNSLQPLLRFLPDGSRDTAFDDALAADMRQYPTSHPTAPWVGAGLLANGDFIVGGGAGTAFFTSETPAHRFIRVRSDGHLVTAYGAKLDELAKTSRPWLPWEVDGIRVRIFGFTLDGERAIAVGQTELQPGEPDRRGVVIRLDADGSLDPTFGDGGVTRVNLSPDPRRLVHPNTEMWAYQADAFYGVTLDAQGRILASGTSLGGVTLTRLLPSGAVDTSFGNAGTVDIAALRNTAIPVDYESTREWARGWAGMNVYAQSDRLLIPVARPESYYRSPGSMAAAALAY